MEEMKEVGVVSCSPEGRVGRPQLVSGTGDLIYSDSHRGRESRLKRFYFKLCKRNISRQNRD